MRRVLVAIVALSVLAGEAGTGPVRASPAGNAGEDYAMLSEATRETARGEDLRARRDAAAQLRRRIAEAEQALAAWGVDRAGATGQ